MYTFSKKSFYLLFLITTLILVGCGGGSGQDTETKVSSSPSLAPSTTSTSKIIHLGQVKDSQTGNALNDVKVTLGTVSTTTDKNGFYSLGNLNTSDKTTINFTKKGYLLGSTQIKIKATNLDNSPATNYLEYNLYPHDYQYNQETKEEISSPHIDIHNSVSYIDIDGNNYHDLISVEITILNEEQTLIPNFTGTFEGINNNGILVQFETFGLISTLIKDNNDNKLTFSEGDTGTLIFKPIISTKEDTIALWHYNYEKGFWIEKGYAELQNDGTYKAEISHLGTWSLSKPIENESGIYRGRIIDSDGLPIDHVRLKAIGTNWISHDLSTDENGFFEINTIPNSEFRLEAYDYKNKYGAKYANIIPAIASGEIIEN